MANLKKYDEYARVTFSGDKLVIDEVKKIAKNNKVAVSDIINTALLRYLVKEEMK